MEILLSSINFFMVEDKEIENLKTIFNKMQFES